MTFPRIANQQNPLSLYSHSKTYTDAIFLVSFTRKIDDSFLSKQSF